MTPSVGQKARFAAFAIGLGCQVAYLPGVKMAATQPRWAFAALALPLLLFVVPRGQNRSLWAVGFLAWAMVSVLWAPLPLETADGGSKLLIVALAFVAGASVGEELLLGMAWGVTVSSLLACAQVLGWHPVIEAETPSGLYANKNLLAEVALPLAVWCAASRRWLLAALLFPAVVLPVSRGVFVAAGATGVLWLAARHRIAACCVAGAVLLGLGTVALSPWRHAAINDRVAIWSDTASGLTLAGHGIGQYYTSFPLFEKEIDPSTTRIEHAHNDWLELGFELGLPGLVLGLGLALQALCGNDEPARLAFGALLVISVFAFPWHVPGTAVLDGVLAGWLSGRRSELRSGELGWTGLGTRRYAVG